MAASNKAFTMIELLIVISIIGILAGVTIAVMNPNRQKAIAEDAVKRSNLEKIAQGIEAFFNLEGSYPLEDDSRPVAADVYIKMGNWPEDTVYDLDATGGDFTVCVPSSTDPVKKFFKYRSDWGELRECTVDCDGWDCTS